MRCYECEMDPGRLAIVEVTGEWHPQSWKERPAAFELSEIIDEERTSEMAHPFCMGFNHQAKLAGSNQWAVLLEPVPACVP